MNINNMALIECFLICGVFSMEQIRILNRVRKYKKVHFLSEILLCGGKTVKPSMLNKYEGDSTRTYSREQPWRKDMDLWRSALREISSPTLFWSPCLGIQTMTCGTCPMTAPFFIWISWMVSRKSLRVELMIDPQECIGLNSSPRQQM